jgi:putative hydrolase of the HAD superfamily
MRALRRPLTGPTAPRRAERVWLLDLDDTLHDAQPVIMPRIDAAMTDYVVRHLGLARDEASELRRGYWKRYGATLLGLVTHHPVDPHHYLRETHRFPDMHRLVRRRPALARALRQLPGRRIIVTNGPWHYARAVVRALGIAGSIEGIVPIEAMRFAGRFQPKPSRPMMRRLAARLRTRPSRCVLVDDAVGNLAGARAAGLRTVLATALKEARKPAPARARAGSSRRVELQVQSVAQLSRRVPSRSTF